MTDSTGAVLPNVTVTAVSVDTNASRSTVTRTIPGPSAFPNLPLEPTGVTASAEGFKSAVQTVTVQSAVPGECSPASGSPSASDRRRLKWKARRRWSSNFARCNDNNYADAIKIENVPLECVRFQLLRR